MDQKKGKLKWIMLHHTMLHRSLGILLAFVMVLGTLPINGITVSASENREAGLCKHHENHTADCGYSEEGNTPCGYECRICPIEELIVALPDQVTEDNADDIRAQLDEILDLYRELTEDEQEQIDISRCYALQEALNAANVPVPTAAKVSVDYQAAVWNESECKVTYTTHTGQSCTQVESSAEAVVWNTDWYVVNSNATIDQPITVNGGVNLILADGCTLNAMKGIVVPKGTSLTIYAQENGSGTLNATGTVDDNSYNASAGIGGSTTSFDSGEITIHGGIISATGGGESGDYGGAGIGGGAQNDGNDGSDGGSGSKITIYGGKITANSGAGRNATGAGIGGGVSGNGGSGSEITIYGGSVTAVSTGSTGSNGGAGIGGGGGIWNGGDGVGISIWGGTVHAIGGNGGAGIGGGRGNSSGLNVVRKSGSGMDITISGGKVTAVGGQYAAGIGGGGGYFMEHEFNGNIIGSSNLIGGSGNVKISGGIVDAKSGESSIEGYEGDSIGNGGNTSGTKDVAKSNAIIFENGTGTVYGPVTLTEPYDVPEGYTLDNERGVFNGSYMFYKDGKPMPPTDEPITITGPFTLKECGHEGVEAKDFGSGKHGLNCPYCGYSYSHDSTVIATAEGNTVTLSLGCGTDGCGYGERVGTVDFAFQNLVYGNPDAKVTWGREIPDGYTVYLKQITNSNQDMGYPFSQTEESLTVLYDGTTVPKIPAGDYNLSVFFINQVASTSLVSNTCELTFKVAPVTLTDSMVMQPAAEFTYNGQAQEPGVTVRQGQTTLRAGVDYEVSYTRNGVDSTDFTSAGTVAITITGKGNYEGAVKRFLTVNPRNLDAAGVAVSEVAGTYTYNGSEIKPSVEVNDGTPTSGIYIFDSGAALTTNDFTVSYSNNKNAGAASVTINGKGNYTGSVTKTFTIGKAPGRTIPDLTGSYTDNGETYIYTITPVDGAVYRMGDSGGWTTPGETAGNVFQDIKPGTSVTFYAKMPETENYKEGAAQSITVDFPKLTQAAPALSYTRKTDEAAGKITLTIAEVTGAEYSFDGGQTWTDSSGQDGFDASQTVILAIRMKETDTHNQSPAQTVTVNLAKKDREVPPAFTLSVEANGETDYTVTIPSTEGCEYSFDGETWSEGNVKAGVKVGGAVTGYMRYKETDEYNASGAVSDSAIMPKFTVKTPVISPAGGSYSGSISVTITCGSQDAEIYYTMDGSTPGRSSTRYTGAFTVSAPATVKAVAIKDGLNDSAATTVSYTKQGGGSGSGTGGSTGSSGGSSPGGSGSAGSGTGGSSGSIGSGMNPASKQPFIKDSSGREGWDVIRAEAETAAAAPAGGTVLVDMNGAVSVPGSIFAAVRGKDVTLCFDMGSGITWSVNGKDVTAETAGDTDFSVKADAGAIPKELIAEKAGGFAHLELSLAHEGAFGFTATLTLRIVIRDGNGITVGSSGSAAGYTGMYANLFYYNPGLRSLEFICAGQIGEDGTADLPFVHASDYMVILSADPMGGTGTPVEPEETEKPQEPAEQAGVKSVKLSRTLYTYNGKAKKPSVIAVDTEGRKISSKYYTVSYKNNKKVGKATVTVKFKVGYSGTVEKTFIIRPTGTSIKKLTEASGGFTVKWKKKAAQTSGYQIQYSADAGFKGNTRSVFVKKNSKVKKTVKDLKAGKKYYVRIRLYKIVKEDGKNTRIYSAWSRARRVKTLPAASGNKTAAFARSTVLLMGEKGRWERYC